MSNEAIVFGGWGIGAVLTFFGFVAYNSYQEGAGYPRRKVAPEVLILVPCVWWLALSVFLLYQTLRLASLPIRALSQRAGQRAHLRLEVVKERQRVLETPLDELVAEAERRLT